MRWSLPLRVLITALILLVIPLFIMAFFEFRFSFLSALDEAKSQIVEQVQTKESQISEIAQSNKQSLLVISNLLDVEDLMAELPNEQTDVVLKDLTELGDLFAMLIFSVTDKNQFINVASSDPFYLYKHYENIFDYRDILGKKYVSFLIYDNRPPYKKVLSDNLLITSKKTGNPIAIFLIAFPLDDTLKEVLRAQTVRFPLDFALLNQDKIVFAASDSALELQYFSPLTSEQLQEIKISGTFAHLDLPVEPLSSDPLPENGFFEFEFKGKKQIGYTVTFPETERVLLAYTAVENAFKAPRVKFLFIYGAYIGLLLLGGSLVSLLTFRMAKPFSELSQVMNSVKNQNLDARYKSDPLGFEINYLGQVFNEMIDSLLLQMKIAQEEQSKRERFEQELKIGREVQMQLLPQEMPSYPNVELAALFVPAKEVGGDFYDAFINESNEEQRLILTIADTSGKGISACLYSLGVRSLIRGFGKEKTSLRQVISLTSHDFYDEVKDSGMFVTLFLCSYHSKTRTLHYASCGHNPPLVRRKNGDIEILDVKGIALGFTKHTEVEEASIELQEGDIVVLYTDGVTEAHNAEKSLFGFSRLIDLMKNQKDKTASEVVKEIYSAIQSFADPAPQHDDITILVMKVL